MFKMALKYNTDIEHNGMARMKKKCTIISQIIALLLHVSAVSCHLQGVRS
jgi:hypothetical protein